MHQVKSLLLLSDDPDDHQILHESFAEISEDISLFILMDGRHLLNLVEQSVIHPDIIIIDMEMNNIGSEYLRTLNAEVLRHIPIVIYTNQSFQTSHYPNFYSISKRLSFKETTNSLRELISAIFNDRKRNTG